MTDHLSHLEPQSPRAEEDDIVDKSLDKVVMRVATIETP